MSFSESLLASGTRPKVAAALARVIDAEISSQGGLTGMALKGAYASAKKAKPGLVEKGTDVMLPELVRTLEPYWEAKGDQDFGAYLSSRRGEVADSLLALADAKAAAPENASLAKLYKPVRGKAKGLVEDALPRLADAINPFVN